jgi:hypothetical protein
MLNEVVYSVIWFCRFDDTKVPNLIPDGGTVTHEVLGLLNTVTLGVRVSHLCRVLYWLPSDVFTHSHNIPQTEALEKTNNFTATAFFNETKEFNETSNLNHTELGFTGSCSFSKSSDLTQSHNFQMTNSLSKSRLLTRTRKLSQSGKFSSSRRFSTTLRGFSKSNALSLIVPASVEEKSSALESADLSEAHESEKVDITVDSDESESAHASIPSKGDVSLSSGPTTIEFASQEWFSSPTILNDTLVSEDSSEELAQSKETKQALGEDNEDISIGLLAAVGASMTVAIVVFAYLIRQEKLNKEKGRSKKEKAPPAPSMHKTVIHYRNSEDFH